MLCIVLIKGIKFTLTC